jgi:hypothetical protein
MEPPHQAPGCNGSPGLEAAVEPLEVTEPKEPLEAKAKVKKQKLETKSLHQRGNSRRGRRRRSYSRQLNGNRSILIEVF